MVTVWEMVFDHLSKSFDVYPPGTYQGECRNKYIVLKDSGAIKIPFISSYNIMYDIMLYVPLERYSELEPFMQEVEKSLKEIEPLLMPTYTYTPSFLDTEAKSYMMSMTYINHRKG